MSSQRGKPSGTLPAAECTFGDRKLGGRQVVGIDRAEQEGPGNLPGDGAAAVAWEVWIGHGLVGNVVGDGCRERGDQELIEECRATATGKVVHPLRQPEGAGSAQQRQAPVGRRAMLHRPQIGHAEAHPELHGNGKAARLVFHHRQRLAREAGFEFGESGHGGSAQEVEQGDRAGRGQPGDVDRFDLAEQGGERLSGLLRRQRGKPGLGRGRIGEGKVGIRAGVGQMRPMHGGSFRVILRS
jgi:hypothetical protein